MRIYYRGNTQVIEMPELTDDKGVSVVGASVEVTITMGDGSPIPGLSSPIVMNDEGAGKYIGIIPPIELPISSHIMIEIVSLISGVTATSVEKMVIKDRAFTYVKPSC